MAFPASLQKLPSAGALWIFNMHMALLFHHSIAVKSALVFMRISPLFSFVFGLVSCLACSGWQCHNNKSVYSPSHQIIQGKKRNCPCIMCGHILLSCQFCHCRMACCHVLCCVLSVLSQVYFNDMCIQSSHKVLKFWCRNAWVSLVRTVWKWTSHWRKK